MPEMDGFGLTSAIRLQEREGGGHVPIIAFTANALRGESERCLLAGMDDYLSKPVELQDLQRVLHKWMPPRPPAGRNDVKNPSGPTESNYHENNTRPTREHRRYGMSTPRLLTALTVLCLSFNSAFASGKDGFDDLLSMDLDQLLNLKVSSASGVPESARHAPAALIVITADDIRERGYDSLVDVLQDVPGFDISISGGTSHATAWQRGITDCP